jgi:hypothetical protein
VIRDLKQAGMGQFHSGTMSHYVVAAPRIQLPGTNPPDILSAATILKTGADNSENLAASTARIEGVYGIGVLGFSFQVLAIAWGMDRPALSSVVRAVLQQPGVTDHRVIWLVDGGLTISFTETEIVIE